VVIIGRNEGERLTNCIHSVQAMHGSMQVEIIYVDSDSTDGSAARAAALGAKVLIVHPERPAAAIGRNAGWQVATAPYVLFLDGDTLLHPDFVPAALKILEENPQVAIVWGHRRERFPEKSWYQRTLDLDWIYPPGISDFCGGDALTRRDVLQQVGGYDPNLIAGEEPEMCQRVRQCNYQIWHIDAPMTLHDLAITRWSQYWRRAVRAGHAYAEVSQRFKNSPFPLWQREAGKSLLHAAALLILLLFSSGLAIYLQSWLPCFAALGIFLLLSGRTAWKVRWKSNNWFTLFLYGLHSQFQHIPIAFGQLGYFYHRWLGKQRGLIEYK
jgi:cellulose synthase/poly-beta-1,6-N-acetylglucosamine synthase-like glycosyltransferase